MISEFIIDNFEFISKLTTVTVYTRFTQRYMETI